MSRPTKITQQAAAPADDASSLRPCSELRPHPEAALVPSLPPAEYAALREDIAARGILTPLDTNASGVVLDGHERLRAAIELGLVQVRVRVVSPSDERTYMLLQALRRKHLNPGQRAVMALALPAIEQEREAARKRQRANLKQSEVATLPPRGERTREWVARLAGVSPRIVQDAEMVQRLDAELLAEVRRGTRRLSPTAQRLRRQRRDAELGEAPPLPEGVFDLLYADPPWPSQSPNSPWAPEAHYPTSSFAQIEQLPVPAAEQAVLFLWAVPCQLLQAEEVLRAWGFESKTQIIWVKPSIGLGNWVRHRHELLLIGRKGDYPLPAEPPDSVIEAPRGRHSEKPEIFYELIERMYPQAKRLELFARKSRPGWSAWGNELSS